MSRSSAPDDPGTLKSDPPRRESLPSAPSGPFMSAPPMSHVPASVGPAEDDATSGMPKRFGKYTLLRKLAQGGMAELFLAIQRSVAGFEKLIVIKRILPAVSQDTAFIEMLLHEARVAATLSHPNVCQTFDVGQAEGSYFIAMEHVHGEDLRSIVRQMKKRDVAEFPVEHAIAIVLGMCAGLAYAHEHHDMNGKHLNIVHRDVSPQNVVVTFAGDVKIVDFGIAKSDKKFTENTKSGKLKGKVPYMSPEQARGEEVDARTDIFATGVVLFELTTGKRLFKGASEFETLKLICDEVYPLPSQVRPDYPRDLEAIVMRALSKNKDERYASAREMQRDLEELVRRHRIPVSNTGLRAFMQDLFRDTLAAQNEAIVQGKQLADMIDSQFPRGAESTLELDPQQSGRIMTPSIPSAAHTVTDAAVHRPRGKGRLVAGVSVAVMLAVGIGVFAGLRSREGGAPTNASTDPQKAQKGTLKITSEPPGASIWVNGDLRSEVTPAVLDLPKGVELDLKLSMPDHEQSRHKVTLTDLAPEHEIKAELRKGSVIVDVSVHPAQAAAALSLDGKAVTGPEIAGIASGVEHTLLVSAPGYLERSVTFTGNAQERKKLDVTLDKAPVAGKPGSGPVKPPAVPTPAGSGKLNVGASGGWCNVTVDGQGRGATPIAGLELSAGSHKVTCTTADGKALSAVVSVPVDGVARYKFTL